jgi:hypothetical protein
MERNCVSFRDSEASSFASLCMACAEDYMEESIAEFQAAKRHLQEFREDRCNLCPIGVQAKCVTKGVNVPMTEEEMNGLAD